MDYLTAISVPFIRRLSRTLVLLGAALGLLFAQNLPTPRIGATELIQTLDRLNEVGSVLMIGAHPDDENTAVIAYFARGRHLRTAYLSATRGEGGQNLIGGERYEALGLLRTQELLAARRIDGAEQFFTRAFDFGFSKNPEEALAKWGRERLVSDFVRVIRKFRPDVVIQRFPPPPGTGGHGHHTATGYMASVAVAAAADPQQFPEQIREGLQPWKAKRLVWNVGGFGPQAGAEAGAGRVTIDAGAYDPVLGKSYAELSGESRTQHESQAMGTPERQGTSPQTFAPVAGDPVKDPPGSNLLEGVDTTWGRIAGGARAGQLLWQARQEVHIEQPDKILPLLLDAAGELEKLQDPWVAVKRPELLHAIAIAAGLSLEARADRWDATPGSALKLTLTALNRSSAAVTWEGAEISGVARATGNPGNRRLAYNEPQHLEVPLAVPAQAPYSQPYFMREPRTADSYPLADTSLIGAPEGPPTLEASFRLHIAERSLTFRVPVVYKWVEPAGGEQARSVEVVPTVSVDFLLESVVFPAAQPRPLRVRVTSNTGAAKGTVSVRLPAGWRVDPPSAPFDLAERSQQETVTFTVTPPAAAGGGIAAAEARVGDATVAAGLRSIHYPHIPTQIYLEPARARVERFDVRLTSRNVGYIMGAGDEMPQALEQLGATVRLLSAEDLATGDLGRFDAIITGVRALNVRPDLLAARQRLLDYVSKGGTLVVQYNTTGGPGGGGTRPVALAPYPLSYSAVRVSVEDAPVTLPNPALPIRHTPNEITLRDFDGWIQERGLYFANKWDEHYQPLFICNDPGEPPQAGGTLYARYGKGVYIFTAVAWFRQLPGGVPGAFRIFANLVSAKQ